MNFPGNNLNEKVLTIFPPLFGALRAAGEGLVKDITSGGEYRSGTGPHLIGCGKESQTIPNLAFRLNSDIERESQK